MRGLQQLELLILLAGAIAAFAIPFSSMKASTRVRAYILIGFSVAVFLCDRVIWAQTGRGMVDHATCAIAPVAKACLKEGRPGTPDLAAASAAPQVVDNMTAAGGGAPRPGPTAPAAVSPFGRMSGFLADQGWLNWIVIGIITSLIFKMVMPGRDPSGCLFSAVLGIAGAALAGFFGQQLGLYRPGDGVGLLASIVGVLLVLVGYRIIARR